jgi:hypothetical protein
LIILALLEQNPTVASNHEIPLPKKLPCLKSIPVIFADKVTIYFFFLRSNKNMIWFDKLCSASDCAVDNLPGL